MLVSYSGKISRTKNFAVFEDFTTTSKINFLISYSIESYDSLVDPRNLICELYRGEITSKFFSLKNYPLCGIVHSIVVNNVIFVALSVCLLLY